MASRKITIIVVIAAAVIAASLIAFSLMQSNKIAYPPNSDQTNPTYATIDGVECRPAESLDMHIHTHLDVIVNDHAYTVPGAIGIPGNQCFYWLHTHSTDGIIHIESPRQMNFTLGQFIDIWDHTQHDPTLSASIAAGPVTAYVNGVKYQGDYRTVQLNSREEIALVIGSSSTLPIPATYPDSGPPA